MAFDYSKFRKNLGTLLENRGLSYLALSHEINITAATLSRYMSDPSKVPSLEYVMRIAEYFNVSVDWMLGLSGDRYEVLPKDIQEIVHLYSVATPDDKKVIWAILGKYQEDKHDENQK